MNPFFDVLQSLIQAWKNQPDRTKRRELAGLIVLVVCAALVYSLAQMHFARQQNDMLNVFQNQAAAPWTNLNAQNDAALKDLPSWTAQMNAQNAATLQALSQWSAQQNAQSMALLNSMLGNQPAFPTNPYLPAFPGVR
jgi:hypothetical protein